MKLSGDMGTYMVPFPSSTGRCMTIWTLRIARQTNPLSVHIILHVYMIMTVCFISQIKTVAVSLTLDSPSTFTHIFDDDTYLHIGVGDPASVILSSWSPVKWRVHINHHFMHTYIDAWVAMQLQWRFCQLIFVTQSMALLNEPLVSVYITRLYADTKTLPVPSPCPCIVLTSIESNKPHCAT